MINLESNQNFSDRLDRLLGVKPVNAQIPSIPNQLGLGLDLGRENGNNQLFYFDSEVLQNVLSNFYLWSLTELTGLEISPLYGDKYKRVDFGEIFLDLVNAGAGNHTVTWYLFLTLYGSQFSNQDMIVKNGTVVVDAGKHTQFQIAVDINVPLLFGSMKSGSQYFIKNVAFSLQNDDASGEVTAAGLIGANFIYKETE